MTVIKAEKTLKVEELLKPMIYKNLFSFFIILKKGF